MQNFILIMGLGNPGYDYSYHNLGSDILKNIIKNQSVHQFNRYAWGWDINNKNFIGFISQDYINNAGISLVNFLKQIKYKPQKIIIITDCAELDWGVIKIDEGSKSAKGHNGIRDIKKHYGDNFIKIRVGIKKNIKLGDYVLDTINDQERKDLLYLCEEIQKKIFFE